MHKIIYRFFRRIKNKIWFKYKKPISKTSLDIYKIVLTALYHEENFLLCDPKTGDIIIELEELGYHIIITNREVIVTNHDFPTLGPIEDEVINRIMEKAREELSRIRQLYKNEILSNNRNLIQEVKEKVIQSSLRARKQKK